MSKRIAALLLCAALVATLPARAAGSLGGGDGRRYVALTFDDGPTPGLSEQLLDGLRARFVSATFFLCGYRVDQCPDTVRRMAAEGHELAVHGQSHTYLHNLPAEAVRREILGPVERIEALTGVRPKLLRPPGGLCGGEVRAVAGELGMPIILWNVDPQDWACQDAAQVTRHIVDHVSDGSILLLHDLSAASVSAALAAVDALQTQGYQFCTVSELAFLRRVALVPGLAFRQLPP